MAEETVVRRAKALYKYEGEGLTVEEGDNCDVIEDDTGSGWCLVRARGDPTLVYVPSSYIETIAAAAVAPATPPRRLPTAAKDRDAVPKPPPRQTPAAPPRMMPKPPPRTTAAQQPKPAIQQPKSSTCVTTTTAAAAAAAAATSAQAPVSPRVAMPTPTTAATNTKRLSLTPQPTTATTAVLQPPQPSPRVKREATTPPLPHAQAPAQGTEKARAVMDWTDETSGIALSTGEEFDVVSKDDDTWVISLEDGTLAYVSPVAFIPPVDVRRCSAVAVATCDYSDHQIQFSRDERLVVVDQHNVPGGWWLVRQYDSLAYAPSTYLKLLSIGPSVSSPPQQQPAKSDQPSLQPPALTRERSHSSSESLGARRPPGALPALPQVPERCAPVPSLPSMSSLAVDQPVPSPKTPQPSVIDTQLREAVAKAAGSARILKVLVPLMESADLCLVLPSSDLHAAFEAYNSLLQCLDANAAKNPEERLGKMRDIIDSLRAALMAEARMAANLASMKAEGSLPERGDDVGAALQASLAELDGRASGLLQAFKAVAAGDKHMATKPLKAMVAALEDVAAAASDRPRADKVMAEARNQASKLPPAERVLLDDPSFFDPHPLCFGSVLVEDEKEPCYLVATKAALVLYRKGSLRVFGSKTFSLTQISMPGMPNQTWVICSTPDQHIKALLLDGKAPPLSRGKQTMLAIQQEDLSCSWFTKQLADVSRLTTTPSPSMSILVVNTPQLAVGKEFSFFVVLSNHLGAPYPVRQNGRPAEISVKTADGKAVPFQVEVPCDAAGRVIVKFIPFCSQGVTISATINASHVKHSPMAIACAEDTEKPQAGKTLSISNFHIIDDVPRMCYLAATGLGVKKVGGHLQFVLEGSSSSAHPFFTEPAVHDFVCAPSAAKGDAQVFLAWKESIVPVPPLPPGFRPVLSLADGTFYFHNEPKNLIYSTCIVSY